MHNIMKKLQNTVKEVDKHIEAGKVCHVCGYPHLLDEPHHKR